MTRIEHRTWGSWPSVRLSTDLASLEVVGEVGARIVSLRDERRRREWLLQGEPPTELEGRAWTREDVVFGGRESFGWDECFPTTAPCGDPLDPEAPALRDHGDQWGRGAYLAVDDDVGSVVHTWSVPRWSYRLSRRLSFEDDRTLLAEYHAASRANEPIPVSWAAHPVLALEPGSAIDLPDVYEVGCSWRNGIELSGRPSWPKATTDDGRTLDLSCVRQGEGWAAVLYAAPEEQIRAVAPDGARLDFDWDLDFAPRLRVWLSYGGWPPDGERREQVALEPCTSEHDDLAGAVSDGAARTLAAGGELRWWLRLTLS